MSKGPGTSLLSALAQHIRSCLSTSDGIARPEAILWTDPKGQWRPLIPTLLKAIPELIQYGEYDIDARTGPAIWLRCVVDGSVELSNVDADAVPIVYLPGIGRQHLRAGEECPDALKPLVELMYRGALWLQRGHHDWTVTAFMTSPRGLELDIAGENRTTEALLRALPELATEPVSRFHGRRLEADDFDQMLATYVIRDLLLWMNDQESTRERLGDNRWAAFCNQCQQQFSFNPDSDDETTAGENLGAAEGVWAKLWERFEEAPANYPGIPELLRRSKPGGLIFEPSRWPDENEKAENEVRQVLARLSDASHTDACARVIELESQHGPRRSWIWHRLGMSPMADVLAQLAELARHTRSALGGQTPGDIARSYVESGWQADRAAWQAVGMAMSSDKVLVQQVVQRLLEPWIDQSARAFQTALQGAPLPDRKNAEKVTVSAGQCLLFSDGLRYDLGEKLRERLEACGCRADIKHRWAALPTVTATAKPAITPVADRITGEDLPADFAPTFDATKKSVNASTLRSELEQSGVQLLTGGMGDWPDADDSRGWIEFGKIDTRGHQHQGDLPHILNKELEQLVDRITSLLDGGWRSVRVVTDHGWVYLPLGLPKVDLPKHLTASRWARCATISGDSQVDVPTAAWHWNPTQFFATGPGVACFTSSNCYAHGGLSIQECLTPDIHVERVGEPQEHASIDSVTWKGLRCFVVAAGTISGVKVDLRLESPSGESVAATSKDLDADGSISLVLKDDEYETLELVVVLLGKDDKVLAQYKTKVGIDS